MFPSFALAYTATNSTASSSVRLKSIILAPLDSLAPARDLGYRNYIAG